ncbi:MAG: ParB/RepB/Spo0J family partition protein [Acidobacteria bacterium]|nr:ParB/RepB/Spo0J family partition protein [Acidobacteriota bacterium]
MPAIEEPKAPEKRRALGRGLDSLLPSGPRILAPLASPLPAALPQPASLAQAEGERIADISLELIDQNPYQTRRSFDSAALNELVESIKANGLAQPIVVRPQGDGRYQLVLGERRCRALKMAGKTTVPAIIRKLGDQQAAETTVIENLQRQDLNCLEQAQAFARLSRDFNLTQEQIGQRVGVSRESVANYLRLLKLPGAVLDFLGQGKLGFSEARVLLEAAAYLEAPEVVKLAEEALERNLTVKELQARVARLKGLTEAGGSEPIPRPADPNVKAAEADLERMLGMRVHIRDRKGKGTILIQYRSIDDFEHLLGVLGTRN